MGATAEQLGVMKLSDALRKAQSLGMDLVEVAPTANPPVCKIVDFGKFRYDIAKQEKEKKTSGTKLKEIKFRVNIDGHDYLTKIRHGEALPTRGESLLQQMKNFSPRGFCAAVGRGSRCRCRRGTFSLNSRWRRCCCELV